MRMRGVLAIEPRNSLLAAISHDVRTPLAALVGMAESLAVMQPPPTGAQAEVVAAMRDAAQRMNALVNNLLDMARLQSGPVQLNRQWQPLEEVVGSSLKAMAGVLDPQRVRVNLLENAVKYTPVGSPIEVGAAASSDSVTVTVDDHGPGLPKGREEAVFQLFERGRKGTRVSPSTCRAARRRASMASRTIHPAQDRRHE